MGGVGWMAFTVGLGSALKERGGELVAVMDVAKPMFLAVALAFITKIEMTTIFFSYNIASL